MVGVAGLEPATPSSRTMGLQTKLLIILMLAVQRSAAALVARSAVICRFNKSEGRWADAHPKVVGALQRSSLGRLKRPSISGLM